MMGNINQANIDNVPIPQNVETKPNKMPKGMKVILVYFFVALFITIVNIGNISASLHTVSLFGVNAVTVRAIFSLLGIIFIVFYILGIFLRQWWKSMLILMGFNLFIYLLMVVWILSMSLSKLATTFNYALPVTRLRPEQVESIGRIAKMIVAVPVAIGVIVGLIILLYIYKHKEYFKERA